MIPLDTALRRIASTCIAVWTLLFSVTSHAASPAVLAATEKSGCEDLIVAKVQVDPKLSFKFFNATETSRPWHVVEHEDGGLEDALDGSIDPEDLILLEHTSACLSTHQGEHAMPFCDARSTGDSKLHLLIHGGEPGHFSSLTVDVDAKNRDFTCSFEAVYPSPTPALNWRITKKSMRAKSLTAQPGHRFYAWISVKFDEVWMENGTEQKRSYKIEGPVKPVIESPAKKE